jgi:phosphatidylinositol kinase/protein kinase (PI-3  family)
MDDLNCRNAKLSLSTFQVVPITNRSGVAEWVNDTVTLKQIIIKDMNNIGIEFGK